MNHADMRATVERGRLATEVIENAAYREAMQALKERIHADWSRLPMRDAEGQALHLLMRKVADQFENTLAGFVAAGRDATARLELDSLRSENPLRKAIRSARRTE